ncbi:hypothetical protein HRbin36_02589 [bacterium HR36]|nr:hypothetical protein HRbin36_02589 [bacterium HR36]
MPGHFVMRNEFVVPVHHVQAAIGSEVDGHWAEPFAGRKQKVSKPFETVMGAIGEQANCLDSLQNGIGYVHHVAIGIWPAILVFRISQARQTGAAEAKMIADCWLPRGIRPQLFHAMPGKIRPEHQRHHTVTQVVRLLNKHFALPGDDKTPDIVQPAGDDLEAAAIGLKPGHFAIIEAHLLTVARSHHRAIERPLGQINPVTRPARELMRIQMRVLNSKTAEHYFPLISLAITIAIA